jgi:hypothetical protein
MGNAVGTEDDVDLAGLFQMGLEFFGYGVRIARDGLEAYALDPSQIFVSQPRGGLSLLAGI